MPQKINENNTSDSIENIDKDDREEASSIKSVSTQQATANLHPYRTMTHHYAAVKQPSISGTISDSSSSAIGIEQQSVTAMAERAESVKKDANSDKTDSVANLDSSIDGNIDILNSNVIKSSVSGQLPAQGLEHYLQEQERQLIITALKQTGWNKTQAAELLGTTFRSLRYRMTKLEIAEDQAE